MAQLASLLIAVCALGAAVAYPNSVLSNSLLKTLNERGNADVAIILKSGKLFFNSTNFKRL